MRFTKILIILILFAIMPFLSHADIAGDPVEETELDTLAELNNQITDADIASLAGLETLTNKTIDGNNNTVKILRHATDCTTFTTAVDGQYCWEKDADLLYVCETADVCDTAGEWDAVASGGGLSAADIDTFAELDAIVADEVLVNTNDTQTLTGKTVDGNDNTIQALRHATDCTGITTGKSGQFCYEQDSDNWYVCEPSAGDCDTAGEWKLTNANNAVTCGTASEITCSGCVADGEIASTFLKAADINPLADLNTVAGTTLQNFNTLTDENLCSYEATGTQIDCDTPTSTFEAAGTFSGIGSCTNQFVRALNDGSAPTCATVADADVVDTITASNYLPLAGGTLTGPLTLDDTSLKITEGVDTVTLTVPALTADRAITLPDAAGEISLLGQSIADAEVDDNITASSYLPLIGGTLTGNLIIDDEKEIRLTEEDAGGANYIGFKAPAALGGDLTLTWNITAATCSGDGNAGALTINGSNEIVCSADDGGAGGSGDLTAFGSCTTGSCATEGGNDAFPFIYEGTANTEETTFQVTDPATSDKTITFPNLTGTVALSANKLDFFAATTSAELDGVISDDTGSGALVFGTSPSLTTPTLGVATATSVNKVAITAPATSATITIADGKTLTVNNTMSFSAAGDSAVLTVPNATATLVGEATTNTLTNKTLAAADNVVEADSGDSATSFFSTGAMDPARVDLGNQVFFQLRPQANEPPAASFATFTTRNSHPVLRFNGNVCAIWTFVLPNLYQGAGITVEFWYASTETSNDTDWDGSWERIDTAQGIDADSFATAVSADNNNNSGTSGIPTQVSIAFTDGAQLDSCAAGEICRFRLCRDDAADTGGADTIDYIGGAIRETP